MYTFNTTSRNGQPLHLREARAADAAQALRYVHQISGESDFLTFGPGEFTLTEAEEAQYLTPFIVFIGLHGGAVGGEHQFGQ